MRSSYIHLGRPLALRQRQARTTCDSRETVTVNARPSTKSIPGRGPSSKADTRRLTRPDDSPKERHREHLCSDWTGLEMSARPTLNPAVREGVPQRGILATVLSRPYLCHSTPERTRAHSMA